MPDRLRLSGRFRLRSAGQMTEFRQAETAPNQTFSASSSNDRRRHFDIVVRAPERPPNERVIRKKNNLHVT